MDLGLLGPSPPLIPTKAPRESRSSPCFIEGEYQMGKPTCTPFPATPHIQAQGSCLQAENPEPTPQRPTRSTQLSAPPTWAPRAPQTLPDVRRRGWNKSHDSCPQSLTCHSPSWRNCLPLQGLVRPVTPREVFWDSGPAFLTPAHRRAWRPPDTQWGEWRCRPSQG